MKKILITGADSYIGTSLENWLAKNENAYEVSTLDVQTDEWKSYDFSIYEVVFHVAAIVHLKETPELESLYYKVNRDLALDIAKRAKNAGVQQFIIMSSMGVYGITTGVIDNQTKENPVSFYGKAKLEADKKLLGEQSDTFKVSIIRPPMVYGKGCKGNYVRLANLAQKTLIFPNYPNQRSMIYIDNLCEYLRMVIEKEWVGILCPQNAEYVNTSEMVKEIAEQHGRKMKLTKAFNWLLWIMMKINIEVVKKVFGSLIYVYNDLDKNVKMKDFKETFQKNGDI